VILIGYDGSPDARAAVEAAAVLFGDQDARVLTVWEPFIELVTRTSFGLGLAPWVPDTDKLDAASRDAAAQTAAEGAALATHLGINALPATATFVMTAARAILAEAEALSASTIVIGSRGLTGIRSRLLGSVSHEVVQHADRTVVVVPSPDVAAMRSHTIHEDQLRIER